MQVLQRTTKEAVKSHDRSCAKIAWPIYIYTYIYLKGQKSIFLKSSEIKEKAPNEILKNKRKCRAI